jgi:hypothetical protein
LIEVRQRRRWAKLFKIMGLNAIFVFVASVLMIKILVKTQIGTGAKAPNTYTWIYQHLFVPWAGALNGSFFFGLVTVLFWLGLATECIGYAGLLRFERVSKWMVLRAIACSRGREETFYPLNTEQKWTR